MFHDGSDPKRIHNMYAVLYNELVFTILERRFGKHEAAVFARSAATGGQRFPVVSGDFIFCPVRGLNDCSSTGVVIASLHTKPWQRLCAEL